MSEHKFSVLFTQISQIAVSCLARLLKQKQTLKYCLGVSVAELVARWLVDLYVRGSNLGGGDFII